MCTLLPSGLNSPSYYTRSNASIRLNQIWKGIVYMAWYAVRTQSSTTYYSTWHRYRVATHEFVSSNETKAKTETYRKCVCVTVRPMALLSSCNKNHCSSTCYSGSSVSRQRNNWRRSRGSIHSHQSSSHSNRCHRWGNTIRQYSRHILHE